MSHYVFFVFLPLRHADVMCMKLHVFPIVYNDAMLSLSVYKPIVLF